MTSTSLTLLAVARWSLIFATLPATAAASVDPASQTGGANVSVTSPYETGAAESAVGRECLGHFKGRVHALIVSGLCRDPHLADTQKDSLEMLRAFLAGPCRVCPSRITVLDAEPSGPFAGEAQATSRSMVEELARLREVLAPDDLFILYYKGQANAVFETLRFNLAGPDLTHVELAAALKHIDSRMLVVIDSPNSGLAIASLAGAGRIIVTSARGDQPYYTRLSEYLVPALSDPASDGDGDGRVSFLDAYRTAVIAIDELFESQGELKTESALIEDDGDGIPTHQPWRVVENAYDGAAAARLFLVPVAAGHAGEKADGT